MLSEFRSPNEYDVMQLGKTMQEGRTLIGPDREAWNERTDLIAVTHPHHRPGEDAFSKWAFYILVPLFNRLVGHRLKVLGPSPLLRKGLI